MIPETLDPGVLGGKLAFALALVALAMATWWVFAFRRRSDAVGATRDVSASLFGALATVLLAGIVILEEAAVALMMFGDALGAHAPYLGHAIATAVGFAALEGLVSLDGLAFLMLSASVMIALVAFSSG